MFAIKGSHSQGFRIETITLADGTDAPDAVLDLPNVGVAFLSNRGFRVIAGAREEEGYPAKVVPIGQSIYRTMQERAGKTNLQRTQAVVDPERHEAWWQLPDGGDNRLRLGIVYHYAKDTWSIREDWPVGAFAELDGNVFFGSNNPTDHLGIFVLTHGSNKDGDALNAIWQHNGLELPQRANLSRFALVALANYSSFSIETRTDNNDRWRRMADTDPVLAHTEPRNASLHHPRWGSALWSVDPDDLWSDYDVARVPLSVSHTNAFIHSFRIQGGGIRMTDVRLGFDQSLGQTDIEQLEGRH